MVFIYDENEEVEIRWESNGLGPIEYRWKGHPQDGWIASPLQWHPNSTPLEDIEEWMKTGKWF